MEVDSIKCYFDWNDALRRYFLTESDLSVKLLCLDDNTLDIIGSKYDISINADLSFHEHFRKSAALSIEARKELLHYLCEELHCDVPSRKGTSLFQLAYQLSISRFPAETPKRYDLPFLALIALFILLSDYNKPKLSVIHSIAKLTGNNPNDEDGGWDYIPHLFTAIKNYDPRFDNNRRGAHQNVGRLQYQKVLNQRELYLFKRFLYSHNIIFDDALYSYEELMNRIILRRLTGEYRDLYQRIVQDNKFVYEEYYTRQIQSFDRNAFEEELANADDNTKTVGYFYLVITFTLDGLIFSVYTDVKVKLDVETRWGVIPAPEDDSDNGLYHTGIPFESLDSYRNLTHSDSKYEITSGLSGMSTIIFKETNNNLVQVHTPEHSYAYYVIINKNNQREIDALNRSQHAESVDFGGQLEDNYLSFYVSSWQAKQRERRAVRNEFKIKAGPGIPVPGQQDTFFDKGLPSIVVPNNYDSNRICVERDVVGRERRTLGRNLNKHYNKIYIDLAASPDNLLERTDYRIRIKDRNTIIDSYSVYFPNIDSKLPLSNHIFSYDGWNRICSRKEVPILRDNIIENCVIKKYGTRNYGTVNNVSTWPYQEASFRCIELLRSSYLKSGALSRKQINEVISYLAGYYGLPEVKDKGEEYYYFINALNELGILNKSFDDKGHSVYQLSSPRLFPTGGEFSGAFEYVLYGAYIKEQISNICQLTSLYRFTRPYSEDDITRHCYLSFIPYYLIVSLNNEQLERLQSLGITYEPYPLSDALLSFIKSPVDFPGDFLTEENSRPYLRQDIKDDSPMLVDYNGDISLIKGGKIYDSYTPDNQKYRRIHIPAPLLKQYYSHLTNTPCCLIAPDNGQVAFLSNMAIPDLFKKCLSYLSLGIATASFVFALDGFLGDRLLHKLTVYRVNSKEQILIAQKLSGKENPTTIKYSLYPSDTCLRHYKLFYVKSDHPYDPFQLFLYLSTNMSIPLVIVRKIQGAYHAFLRRNKVYHKMNYSSAADALSAVIKDDDQINDHIDVETLDIKSLTEGNVIKKEIQIIKKYD